MPDQNKQATTAAAFQALNEHDLAIFIGVVGPTYSLYAAERPGALQGEDEIREFLAMLFTAFPDFQAVPLELETVEEMGYQEVVLRGTHRGPLLMPDGSTLAATEKSIILPTELFHRFDEAGKLIATTVRVDLVALDKQLGLE